MSFSNALSASSPAGATSDGQGGATPPASDRSGAAPATMAPALRARRLMRACDRAALATVQRPTTAQRPTDEVAGAMADAAGWPYPSLVLVAFDHDGSPLLLLSTLADHTRNLLADDRVGLLFDGTAGLAQPLTGARLSVQGRAGRSDDPDHRARYLRRHPDAALYAGFGDFAIYRVAVERAHLVAGFGRIHWLSAAELDLPAAAPALAAGEAALLDRLNGEGYGPRLAPATDGEKDGWSLTGIDPEGCDLRRGRYVARVDFEQRIHDPESAKLMLDTLVRPPDGSGQPGGSTSGTRTAGTPPDGGGGT
ncbi:heme iron utilization protein [Azospirillum melinis]|uniref:Heme iron utilization protein n=2 Tax=Azospirillum melinis TaxID=328839 RepID=A0ABX2KBF5_9PROT|nr:putative heme iron utilization protein [Azospirillum melinis]NUB00945.1 heme iron utilization protein [Azospirillum melinis]